VHPRPTVVIGDTMSRKTQLSLTEAGGYWECSGPRSPMLQGLNGDLYLRASW